MSKEPVYCCYKCGEELVLEVKVGRRDICPICYAYIHCCYNCKFWDKYAHNQCTENQGEFIRDRAEGNFCLYWTFKSSFLDEYKEREEKEAKERLNSLFGDKGKEKKNKFTPKTQEEAKQRLEALFKKNN